MPVHLGAMPLSVRAAIDHGPMAPGDIVVLNDPFQGGTHLPDITLVSPVFLGRGATARVLRRQPRPSLRRRRDDARLDAPGPRDVPGRADHPAGEARAARRDRARRAGPDPGQRPHARRARRRPRGADRRQPCRRTRLRADGRRVRPPARWPATRPRFRTTPSASSARRSRAIPDGDYTFEDALDDDGFTRRAGADPRHAAHRRRRRRRGLRRQRPQTTGGVNANFAITLSATLYGFRCLVRRRRALQRRHRARRPRDRARRHASSTRRRPAAVAGGNVETSQRITDVVLGALGAGAARPDAGGQPGHDEQRHARRHRPGTGRRSPTTRRSAAAWAGAAASPASTASTPT